MKSMGETQAAFLCFLPSPDEWSMLSQLLISMSFVCDQFKVLWILYWSAHWKCPSSPLSLGGTWLCWQYSDEFQFCSSSYCINSSLPPLIAIWAAEVNIVFYISALTIFINTRCAQTFFLSEGQNWILMMGREPKTSPFCVLLLGCEMEPYGSPERQVRKNNSADLVPKSDLDCYLLWLWLENK